MYWTVRMVAHALVFAYVAMTMVAPGAVLPFAPIAVLAAVFLAGSRTTWLPFLGPAVVPPTVFSAPEHAIAVFGKFTIEHNDWHDPITMTVSVDETARRVVYWAAEPGKMVTDVRSAYAPWTNVGVADVLPGGHARFLIKCPRAYRVPGGRIIARHVHFREIYENGMSGPVRTVPIQC